MDKRRGIVITAVGVLVLSPDSTLIRVFAHDSATTLFWRGVALAVGGGVVFAFAGHTRAKRAAATIIHPAGLALTAAFVVANATFVWAVNNASVADTLGSIATTAVFAAGFAALFIGERAPRRVWLAAAGSALGLALITAFGGGTLFGRANGVASAAAFGAAFVAMRAPVNADPQPALIASGVILAALFVGPARLDGLATTPALAAAGMALTIPVSMALVGLGSRLLGAAEVGLLMLLETVFGTLWALVFLGEAPTAVTLAAVATILATLGVFYGYEIRLARAARRSR